MVDMAEAENLRRRFEGIEDRAQFARKHKIPGGGSMIYQHIDGRKPIGRNAAIAYAKAFKCSLESISPRIAREVAYAAGFLADSDRKSALVAQDSAQPIYTPSEGLIADLLAAAGCLNDRGITELIGIATYLATKHPKLSEKKAS